MGYRGVFAIPVTPFNESGDLDLPGLEQVVEFAIEAGAHGLVTPVNASEFSALSDEERSQIIRTTARRNSGRLPFVAGVSGVSAEVAVGFAKIAEDAGADAVIAMPPYVRKPPAAAAVRYYERLSAATPLPIFIQNYPTPIGVPMSADLLGRMAREVEHVRYIKEEVPPVTHTVSADIEACGSDIEGIFGGAAGRFMLDEMARGAAGTMPACDVTDVHCAVWDTWENGERDRSRELFNRLLPLLNFEVLHGVNAYKEVLRRRGVIRSAYVRAPITGELDSFDHSELTVLLADLEELFTVR